MFIITIPICVCLASLVDELLINGISAFKDFDFGNVFSKLFKNEKCMQLFLIIQTLFSLFFVFVIFIQKENVYQSVLVNVTDNIQTPRAMGQGQHGTARWLKDTEFKRIFKKNVLETNKKLEEQKFRKGGLIVGYEQKENKENIYYIDKNTHALVVGSTRSGKTRTIVLQTIGNLALAGESMIISDPKQEIYHYTNKYLKDLEYEVIALDFKNTEKSNCYNFLQPVIDAINANNYSKAVKLAWDLTESLAGDESTKMEKIWKDGEMSIIAGAILTVVYENRKHPEFQNLANVYMFINEMCLTENNTMPLNKYIKDLSPENPASQIFGIARIAPERTRSSFFTSALVTLRLFVADDVNQITYKSDFELKDTARKKTAIFILLPDDTLTYYSIASLFVNQQYVSLVEESDKNGGVLKIRTNFILDEFREFRNDTRIFKYADSWWW